MAVTVENDEKYVIPMITKLQLTVQKHVSADLHTAGYFTGFIILFGNFTICGLLIRLASVWSLYKVQQKEPEAISLHVLVGVCYSVSHPTFSYTFLPVIISWYLSFVMLQEKLQNHLQTSSKHHSMTPTFQKRFGTHYAILTEFVKWFIFEANRVITIGRKRLGIFETISGKPLFILNEIYTTEKTYLKNIKALKELFQEPMQAILTYDDGFLKQQSLRIIFQNLPEILQIHEEIFKGMEKETRNGQVIGNNIEPFLIGKYSARMLDSYGQYMKSFEKKSEELVQLQKNEKFSNFLLNQLGNEKCGGQPIDALLIRPIQRIPSLLLLYKDLHKSLLNINSKYSEDIKVVVQELNNVLYKLNHEKGQDEGRQRLLEIANRVENFPQQYVTSDRIFHDHAHVQVEVDVTINEYKLSKEKSKLNIYLMNDMTILTRSKQKSTGIMRSKKDIELFIGIIHLRDILELLTLSDDKFGLKYGSKNSFQYLIVSFLSNKDSFVDKLVLHGSAFSENFNAINSYPEGNFKNGVVMRKRSKSMERFNSSLRNSVDIEL